MSLCDYKDALGKPGQGFHEARLGSFALWDTVGTFAIAALITYTSGPSLQKFAWVSLIVFVLSIILHWVFCVETESGRLLGLTRGN